MENENMGYYDERALFVDGLGQLLKTAYLGVTALRYIYPEQSSNGITVRSSRTFPSYSRTLASNTRKFVNLPCHKRT